MAEIGHDELAKLTEKLLSERAVDFREYKTSTLARRVQRRLEAVKAPDIAAYIKVLDRRSDEYQKLLDSILINVTEFFRDPEAWKVIQAEVIPRVVSQKRPGDQIRFWSAGCATGEEPYSLAMIIAEALGQRGTDFDVRVYATDIDDDALAIARRAEYSEDAVKSIPGELLERYLTRNARYTVNREVRRMVIFGSHNLVTDAPISHVDLIVCRNVLIYMTVDLQNRILSKFQYGLESQGFLFLGRAESLLTASRLFVPVNEKCRIFRKEYTLGAVRGISDQRSVDLAVDASGAEYQSISLFNEAVLRCIPSGVIAVDDSNVVRAVNPAAEAMWGLRAGDILGHTLFEADLPPALQSVLPSLTQARSQRNEIRIDELDLGSDRGRPLHVAVTLAPMFNVMGNPIGTVILAENITNQIRLRSDLEAANEQLQAANEELETTNEELQSTNEELETTNEELQSTNEELETTNEELQSTNEELSTTNDELAERTSQLDSISLYYNSVVQCLAVPVVVLNAEDVVTAWNRAAEDFYGVSARDAVGKCLAHIDIPVRIERVRERLRRIKASGRTFRSKPVVYQTPSGEERSAVIELRPVFDARDNYAGAICTAYADGYQLGRCT